MSEELVPVSRAAPVMLRPIVKADELIEAQKEISQLIVQGLESGKDYGVIPGTGGKPSLLKPGAERLQKAFGCHTEFDVIEKEIDHDREVKWTKTKWEWSAQAKRKEPMQVSGTSHGLYRYVVRATVIGPHGQAVGAGLGSCSTLENKYIDRPRDLENTILKMAQKRAKVAATLDAFALSDRFTQDMDDVSEEPREESRQEKQARPVPSEPAAKHDEPERFDPKDRAHCDRLRRALTSMGVTDEGKQDKIAVQLAGKPMVTREIEAAIALEELPF